MDFIFAHVEGWVFESQPRQPVKTSSDSSTTKRSAPGASVSGPLDDLIGMTSCVLPTWLI